MRQVFVRVYWLGIQSVILVFSTYSFVNCCPSNLLSGSTLPPSPPTFPVSKYSIYRQCVAGRGWGVLSPVGDDIQQEFNTLYLTRFRNYTFARPPQQKPMRGGGHRQINTSRKVFLQANFLDDNILFMSMVRLICHNLENTSKKCNEKCFFRTISFLWV